jgi:hypothetical protein
MEAIDSFSGDGKTPPEVPLNGFDSLSIGKIMENLQRIPRAFGLLGPWEGGFDLEGIPGTGIDRGRANA